MGCADRRGSVPLLYPVSPRAWLSVGAGVQHHQLCWRGWRDLPQDVAAPARMVKRAMYCDHCAFAAYPLPTQVRANDSHQWQARRSTRCVTWGLKKKSIVALVAGEPILTQGYGLPIAMDGCWEVWSEFAGTAPYASRIVPLCSLSCPREFWETERGLHRIVNAGATPGQIVVVPGGTLKGVMYTRDASNACWENVDYSITLKCDRAALSRVAVHAAAFAMAQAPSAQTVRIVLTQRAERVEVWCTGKIQSSLCAALSNHCAESSGTEVGGSCAPLGAS